MTSIRVRGSRVSVLISMLLKSNQAHLSSTSCYLLKNNNTFSLPHNNGFQRCRPCLNSSLFTSAYTSPSFQGKQLDVDHGDQGVQTKASQEIDDNDNDDDMMLKKEFVKGKSGFLKVLEHKLSYNPLDSKTAFLLLKSCGLTMQNETNSSRTELVEYVWEELNTKGVEINTALWNTLLSVHNENKHELDPLLFLKNMWEVSGCEPNSSTFQLLLQSYAQRGDVVGSGKIIEFMIQNGNSKLTEEVYAWLMFAFVKNADQEGMNEVLVTMDKAGVRRTLTTYGRLINAQAECGDLDAIDETINEMISKGIYPTSITYMDILTHLVEGGHPELIGAALERMDVEDEIREHILFLVQYCVTNGNYESALKLVLYSEKQTDSIFGYMDHIARILYQRLYNAHKTPDDYLEMVQLIDEHFSTKLMNVKGGVKKGSLYKLTQFFINTHMRDKAIKTLQCALSKNDITTDFIQSSFDLLLRNLADIREVSKLLQLVKCMTDNGMQPSKFSREIIGSLLDTLPSDEKTSLQEDLKGLRVQGLKPGGQLKKLCKKSDVKLDMLNAEISNAKNDELFGCLKDIKSILMLNYNSPEAILLVLNLRKRGAKLWDCIDWIIDKTTGKDNTIEVYRFVSSLVQENYVISSKQKNKMLTTLDKHNLSVEYSAFEQLIKKRGKNSNIVTETQDISSDTLNEMSSNVTDVKTLRKCVQAYLKANEPERCVDTIEEYIAKGNEGTLYLPVMIKVIQSLKFTGNVAYVSKMINIIRTHYPNHPHLTSNSFDTDLILTHLKAGELEEATLIFNRNQQTIVDKCLWLYRNAAKEATVVGDTDYHMKIIDFMKTNNLPP